MAKLNPKNTVLLQNLEKKTRELIEDFFPNI